MARAMQCMCDIGGFDAGKMVCGSIFGTFKGPDNCYVGIIGATHMRVIGAIT